MLFSDSSLPFSRPGDGDRLIRWGALWTLLALAMYVASFFTLPFNSAPLYGVGPLLALSMDIYARKKEKKSANLRSIARCCIDSCWRVVGVSFMLLVLLVCIRALFGAGVNMRAFFVLGTLLPAFGLSVLGFLLPFKPLKIGGIASLLLSLVLLTDLLTGYSTVLRLHHLLLALCSASSMWLPGVLLNRSATVAARRD